MSVTLHYHPLSSFCQKVLIGLYELDVPHHKKLVNLMDADERTGFMKLWPIGKFPVLRDDARDATVPETSIILEYLEQHYARPGRLVPREADAARECRLRDRFFDLYVNMPVGKIVTDKLRPEDKRDVLGVEHALAQLATAYGIAESWLGSDGWAVGDAFTMADCAAAPALFYAEKIVPFGTHRRIAQYFARLCERPSFARVLDEAKPYLAMFPG
jgi:glutathione S-transferase